VQGAMGAALRLVEHGDHVCSNRLYALEGASRGVRWHDIPQDERSALWKAYQQENRPQTPSV